MEEVPAAIAPFQGRILIGVGKLLRIYDLGKKKLLRKCENKVSIAQWGTVPEVTWLGIDFILFLYLKHVPNFIVGIQTIGHRVIVSDVQESFFWVRYKRNENQLIIFADDTHPRWVTTSSLLDYETVAGADKFGNICVVSGRSRYVTQREQGEGFGWRRSFNALLTKAHDPNLVLSVCVDVGQG